jgi:hypothetical protein
MFDIVLGSVIVVTMVSGVGVEPVMAFAGVYLIVRSLINIMVINGDI